MIFAPILQNSEKINEITLQINELNKRIERLQTVISFVDNRIQGLVRVRLEILKCFLQEVKKEKKNPDWNIDHLQKNIGDKIQILRDTLLDECTKRLAQSDDESKKLEFLKGTFDEKFHELYEEFFRNENAFDKNSIADFRELHSGDAYQFSPDFLEKHDLMSLKNRIKESYQKQKFECKALSKKSHEIEEGSKNLELELQPEFEELISKKKALQNLQATDIFSACQLGKKKILKQEIKKKWFKSKFVNQKNEHGFPAIQFACYHDHPKIVSILLDSGADREATDTHGYQGLHWAAQQGANEVVELLLNHKEKKRIINATGEYKRTPLHMAVFNGHCDTVDLLIKNDADINAQTNQEEGCVTPLHYAVEQANLPMVMTLTSFPKLDVTLRNHIVRKDKEERLSPLYYAVQTGNTEIVHCLLNHCSWRDCQDADDPNSIRSLLKNHPPEEIEDLLVMKL